MNGIKGKVRDKLGEGEIFVGNYYTFLVCTKAFLTSNKKLPRRKQTSWRREK